MAEKKNGWKDCWKYTVRCLRDVERCVPGRLTALLPVSLVVALTPYVTIWFSAQLVNELAGARRPEMLWRWTALTLGVSALLGLLKAGLMRWMNTLNSMHNPMKERLFLEKMLSMDFADADSQRVRQLRTKIRENEKWSGFGINEAVQSTFRLVQAVLGILGAAVLTVSLFTARVTQGGMLFLNNPLAALVLLLVMGGIACCSSGLRPSATDSMRSGRRKRPSGIAFSTSSLTCRRNGNGGWTCAFMDSTP